jgi:hypothetical protein
MSRRRARHPDTLATLQWEQGGADQASYRPRLVRHQIMRLQLDDAGKGPRPAVAEPEHAVDCHLATPKLSEILSPSR